MLTTYVLDVVVQDVCLCLLLENEKGEKYMPINLQGRSLLTLADYTPQEINYLIDLSTKLDLKLTRTPHKYLEGKTLSYYLKNFY